MAFPSDDPLAFLTGELETLRAQGRLREPSPPRDPSKPSFCSNDYLGFAASPAPPVPSGAGASRLIDGQRVEHEVLERALAQWTRTEEALLFTSGYAANLGALSALVRPDDVVVSDSLNHASIIDGLRLARARPVVVPHLDVEAVRRALTDRPAAGRAWVVVETYYSMDADSPDLLALRQVCDDAGAALYVDEAHALGVFGPEGAGLCAAAGIRPDVLVGTLGKALGSQGAFVAGPEPLRRWLWNRARSFVFSTGLAPVCAEAAHRALVALRCNPALASQVSRLSDSLRSGIRDLADELPRGSLPSSALDGVSASLKVLGHGHILPIVVGSEAEALALQERLERRGMHVRAVRPPTVPHGTSRLRLTVTALHTDSDVARFLAALRDAILRP